MSPITSPRNPRLRLVRSLADRRVRAKEERFLLEGPRPLLEALALIPERVELVLWRAGDEERVAEALALARERGIEAHAVTPRIFDDLSQVESPQPLIAVARVAWRPLAELLGPKDAAPRAAVALAGVQDPGNVGTILRTAAFFGLAGAVFLPGSQDPWGPKVVRASAGALLHFPPARANADELLGAAGAAGLEPIALAAHGGEPVASIPPRALLLLGAEGAGLPSELARVRAITIAGHGTESLNVAVAFGVAAHAWSDVSFRAQGGRNRWATR